MLLPIDVIKNIDDIVERSYLQFTHMLLGESVLSDEDKIRAESLGLLIGQKPLIELIYVLVRQRSTERYQTDDTLDRLLQSIINMGILPAAKDTELYTIEHAKEAMNDHIQNVKQIIKKDIKREVLKTNEEYRSMQVVGGIQPAINKEEEMTSGLLKTVGIAILASQTTFVRDFVSELTGFVNNTVVDEIKTREGANVSEAQVYKVTTKDGKLCQWCRGFYDNGDKPRIFKLSELQANGTNEGKTKAAWTPVIGATHPHCRCQLNHVIKE